MDVVDWIFVDIIVTVVDAYAYPFVYSVPR